MKIIVIYSGGMDSTVAIYKAVKDYGAKNVRAISFNYQSKHNDQEFKRAQATCKKLKVKHDRISLSSISKFLKSNLLKKGGKIPNGHYAESSMKKTVIPFRNGIMLSIACGIAESWGAKFVIIGNHAGDHAIYPDCRGTFISAMNEAMAYGTYIEVNILSPFVNMTKADIAKMGDELKVDWNKTYSCYVGDKKHCGKCSTCFERREACVLSNIIDPTIYLDKTPFNDLKNKYEKKLKAKK
jgi:7-cyano-7-deazaguanine synthase